MSTTTQQSENEQMSIKDLSRIMRKQDIAMLATLHDGKVAVRPMSNNRDVDFDGDTYFFTTDDTTTVEDIKSDPNVTVSYQDNEEDTYIALSGEASLHTDRETQEKHWQEKLEQWFEDGLDTKGLTLVRVNATRVHHWCGRSENEMVLD